MLTLKACLKAGIIRGHPLSISAINAGLKPGPIQEAVPIDTITNKPIQTGGASYGKIKSK